MMNLKRLTAGRPVFVSLAKIFAGAACGILSVLLVLTGALPGHAGDEFPFDQELLLDAAPMQPVKRVPMLKLAADGRATIDLWCRSVPARIDLAGSAIRIETAPLPVSLPQYMSAGQCSEIRMQADTDMLHALAQVTEWRRFVDGVEFNGPKPFRFRVSSH